jgi:hypothetical protein
MKLSFLDLLCNGIGAMFLVMLVLASKHYVRQDVPERGVLIVHASTQDPKAQLGIWLRKRSNVDTWVDDEIYEYPRAPSGRTASTIEPGVMPRGSFFSVGVKQGVPSMATLTVIDPEKACYEVGVFLKDYDDLFVNKQPNVKVTYSVWFRGPQASNQRPSSNEVLVAPTAAFARSIPVGTERGCS